MGLGHSRVCFGGGAGSGRKNRSWAGATGHGEAGSIGKQLTGEDMRERPESGVTLISQKMGIHEWSYDNDISADPRFAVPWREKAQTLKSIKLEVDTMASFDPSTAARSQLVRPLRWDSRCETRFMAGAYVPPIVPVPEERAGLLIPGGRSGIPI